MDALNITLSSNHSVCMKHCISKRLVVVVFFAVQVPSASRLDADPLSTVQISINDAHGNPLPCRIHLLDQEGRAQKVAGQPFWHDHFVCSGRVTTTLAPGKYEYAIERGPEYVRQTGQVVLAPGQTHALDAKLERITDLRAAGWYSSDLHVHRPLDEIEQLMRAEDLDFAPVITWWNNQNLWKDKPLPQQVVRQFDRHRIYTLMAGEDEREGGALLYFGLDSPLDIETNHREVPSPLHFVEEARKRNNHVWIDIEKPFWWDVPVWLASGRVNSIGIANNHMCRSRMLANEAWGKPRDAQRLPEPRGNGFWTQEIYYHLLNTGLRLPPSAGSASGVLPNPVGYNRVYVHLDEPFSAEAWFRGLSRGRSFVSNGPLLLVTANGNDPGAVFKLQRGGKQTLQIDVQLTTQDPISEIELIQNGKVSRTIQSSHELHQRHTFELTVDKPCWFLVRAITDVDRTFRFVSTAPWYVETSDTQYSISRTSVQFFLDWVDERIERVKANIDDPSQLQSVLSWHERARRFWTDRLDMANAD
jgi:hypothetical protein